MPPPLEIQQLQIDVVTGATSGAGNAGRVWSERSGLLLRLHAGDRVGLGEASPLPGYSPDTFEQARDALEAWRPSRIEASVAGVRRAMESIPESVPSARFAAETALLDVVGQASGEPLTELLSGAVSDAGVAPQPRAGLNKPFGLAEPEGVPNATLLPLDLERPSATLDAALELYEEGFSDFKIKIGRAGRFEDEVRALELLRAETKFRFRLDANGLLDPNGLPKQLKRLAKLDIDFLEEPVPWPVLGEIANSPLPLAIDEGLQRHWRDNRPDVADWLRSGAGSVVVLKPLVLGGVLHCLDIAHDARQLGADAVASHGFDGPIALQATSALAVALSGASPRDGALAHGTAPHAGLAAWPTADGLISQGSELVPSRMPGLGLRFESDAFSTLDALGGHG